MNNKFDLYALYESIAHSTVFIAVGIIVAIGQILQSKDRITWPIALGRCITTGGISLVAGSALAFLPNLPLIAQIGLAAALASLGNSGIEMLLQRVLNK